MTIYFKNGMTKIITRQIAETINKRIISGCGDFQIFSDTEGLCLIVKLSEVVYIA